MFTKMIHKLTYLLTIHNWRVIHNFCEHAFNHRGKNNTNYNEIHNAAGVFEGRRKKFGDVFLFHISMTGGEH